jgi:hypothetical protein
MDISLPTIIILGMLGGLFLWGYMRRGSIFSGNTGITSKEKAKKKRDSSEGNDLSGGLFSGNFGEFQGVRRKL